MKNLLTILIIAFTFNAYNSTAQVVHDINKLDSNIEIMLDSAAKHMLSFICTQNETEHTSAMDKVAKAEEMNTMLLNKRKEEKGVAAKIEDEVISERQEEFDSYKKPSLKDDVLSEKPEQRTIKVHYKGKSYNVGDKSKKHFDTFSEYLPKN